MKRDLAPVLVMILALVSMPGASAGRIELVDGTEINGDVISASNGRYVIRSAALGQIEVPESSIRSIRPDGGSGSIGAPNAELLSMQQQIVSSPELMQAVTALQSDPELQAVINDPELMQLFMSGNLDALRDDPRFLRLLDNPSIRTIVGRMDSQ